MFQELIEEQKRIFSRAGLIVVLYIAAWALPYIYLDIYAPESDGGYFLMSIFGIGLNYALLIMVMDRADFLENGSATGFRRPLCPLSDCGCICFVAAHRH